MSKLLPFLRPQFPHRSHNNGVWYLVDSKVKSYICEHQETKNGFEGCYIAPETVIFKLRGLGSNSASATCCPCDLGQIRSLLKFPTTL